MLNFNLCTLYSDGVKTSNCFVVIKGDHNIIETSQFDLSNEPENNTKQLFIFLL